MMNPLKANELSAAVKQLGIPVFLSGMGRGLLGKENNLQMRHKRKEAIKAYKRRIGGLNLQDGGRSTLSAYA